MATNSALDKWDHLVKDEEEEEEEEEEALSLCDLPDQDKPRKQDTRFGEATKGEQEDDFDFNTFGGLFSEEPEMCAADEVFFQGQILPLRHSFSSEPSCLSSAKGFQIQRNGNNKQLNRCGSRSESMDHGSMSEFRSNSSSRSSSLRSQNSSSSTSSTATTTPRVSKPKIQNQFHTIPSPKPQLRQSSQGSRQAIFSSGNHQGRKSSSAWEFFRLGVVPAPEIGLQDLKVRNSANNSRNCVSRNSSSSSSNNSSTSHNAKSSVKRMSNKGGHDGDKSNHVLKQFVGKGGGLLSGCSCSVDTVAQLDTVMIKGGSTNYKSSNKTTESATHAMKEKVTVAELKKQNKHNNNNNNNNNNNSRHQKQAKKVMSRRRTFEWLKELHASHPDEEEALLLNT